MKTDYCLDRCRLTGTIVADKAVDLTRLYFQCQILYAYFSSRIGLGQMLDF